MTKYKRIVTGLSKCAEYLPLAALAALIASSFCTHTPDNCGDGQRLDPLKQFCHEGLAWDKCGGLEYDPSRQTCKGTSIVDIAVKPTCNGIEYDGAVSFCRNNAIYAKCGGKEYDPSRQECNGTSVVNIVGKPKCNGIEYDGAAGFCYNNTIYAKCGGNEYDPSRQECSGTSVVNIVGKPKCNGVEYDGAASFCYNNTIYSKCGGQEYDPSSKTCNGTNIVNIVNNAKFSVYFNANGGADGSNPPATVKADSGGVITLPEQQTLSRDGYNFFCWNTNASGNGTDYAAGAPYTVTGNVTFYAKWTAVTSSYTLTVSVSPSGGGSVSRSPNQTSYTSGTNVALTATPYSGYTFTGWSGAASGTANPITVTMNGNKSLTANFQQTQVTYSYMLSTGVTPSGGGTVSRSPNQTSYTSGASVTVTATPNSGYTFTGWSGAASGTTNPITITMNGDKGLIANFQQTQVTSSYTLTTNVSPSGGGTVSRSPNQTSYTSGASVTVTATPNSGYTFTGWSGAASGTTNPITITMNGDKGLIANFEQTQVTSSYTLTTNVSPSGGGTVSRSPNQTSYTSGSSVTVTATAASGYTFIGWSGAASGTANSVTITMNGDKSLTANFQQIPSYTLTTNVSPSGGGTVSRSPNQTSYTSGTSVSVTATAASGYTFTGWSGAASGTANPITITMNGDKEVTANFQQQTGGGGGPYESVVIGGKRWMSKNLNIATADSWCYGNDPANCEKYGRLYTWQAALTACPAGWHLPTRQEWGDLAIAAGGTGTYGTGGTAGRALKSTSGWNGSSGNGTDAYGFSALPGGNRDSGGSFGGVGYVGDWWTATEYSSGYAYYRYMVYNIGYGYVDEYNHDKSEACSVRCVGD